MNNSMNFLKRLMAFLLAMLLVTTMMGDDFASRADGDISVVEEAVSTEAAADNEGGSASVETADVAQPAPEVAADQTASEEPAPEVAADQTAQTDAPESTPQPEVAGDVDTPDNTQVVEGEPTTSETPAQTPEAEDNKGNENIDEKKTDSPTIDENKDTKEDAEVDKDKEKDKKEDADAQEDADAEKDDDNKDCEHQWTYIDNGDGTHTKMCALCNEQVTEDCSFEDGECKYCHYHKNKKEEECEHEYEYKSNKDGTHIAKCKKCGDTYSEDCTFDADGVCIYCGYKEKKEGYKLVLTRINRMVDGVNITVKGMMPENATVEINPISTDYAEDFLENVGEGNYQIFRAFDITIYDGDGNKYQPETDGGSVEITIGGMSELNQVDDSDVDVIRVEHDNSVSTLHSDVDGEQVTFNSEHFSYLFIGTKESSGIDTNNYITVSDQEITFTDTLTSTKQYGRVKNATIYVYLEAGYEFSCDVVLKKGLTDNTALSSGTVIGRYPDAAESVTATEDGWYPVGIEFPETTKSWMKTGTVYSVTFTNFTSTVYLKEGSHTVYVDGESISQKAQFAIEQEEKDQPYSIETITLSSREGRSTTGNTIYYAVGEEDTIIGTAKDAVGTTYDVDYTWTKSVTAGDTPIQLSDDGKLKANNPGVVKLTASYGGKSSADYTIIVYDIKLNNSSSYSATYTGSAITPTVTLDDVSEVVSEGSATFTSSIADGTNVDCGTVTVTINGANDKFTFKKTFEIKKRNISVFEFVDSVEYRINTTDDEVVSVSGITSTETGVTPPELDEGMTMVLSRNGVSKTGISYDVTITGIGNYTGTVTKTISYKNDLNISDYIEVNWINQNNKYRPYTGNPVEPQLTEFAFTDMNGRTLDDLNISVSYSDDHTNAGEAEVIFTDADNVYSGELKLSYTIEPANFNTGTFTVEWANGTSTFTYNDEPITVENYITVKYQSPDMSEMKVLDSATDYTLSYSDNDKVGTATVKITGQGNYTGTQTKTFTIEGNIKKQAIIYLEGSYKAQYTTGNSDIWDSGYSVNYSGSTIKPTVKVYLQGTGWLTENTNYTLKFTDDQGNVYDPDDSTSRVLTDAGTKYVVVTGKGGNFDGEVITASYKITPYSVTGAKVSFALSTEVKTNGKTFTGEAVELVSSDYTLKFSGQAMTEGTDFTISFDNNVNASSLATYTITGTGNFKGTKTGKYTISPADLSTATVKFVDGDNVTVPYNGSKREPEVSVTLGNVDITENFRDSYEVTYTNNVSPTTNATATVTPKNNLKGDAKILTFEITAKSLIDPSVVITIDNNPIEFKSSSGSTYYYFCPGFAPTYSGASVAPKASQVLIKDGGTTINRGTGEGCGYTVNLNIKDKAVSDYDTHVANNTLSNAARIEITGRNNYVGSKVVIYYNIVPRMLNDTTTTIKGADGTSDIYAKWVTGTDAKKPSNTEMVVKYGSTILEQNVDYIVEFASTEDETLAKTAGPGRRAQIKGIGSYSGTMGFEYAVGTNINNSASAVVLKSPYNAEEYTTENDIFKVQYMGNAKPVATIYPTGTSGSALATTDYTVESETSSVSGGTLYDSYAGTNIITVTLKGNESNGCYGTKTYQYRIVPVDLTLGQSGNDYYAMEGKGTTDSVETNEIEYTGSAISITDKYNITYYVKKTSGENVSIPLTYNEDYRLDKDTVGPSLGANQVINAIAITTGKGNYYGTRTYSYKVVACPIDKAEFGETSTLFKDGTTFWSYYTGSEIKHDDSITVTGKNGKTLTSDDYDITYANNTNVGTATVTITGKGNYSGSVTLTFEIKSIDASQDEAFVVALTKNSFDYNGEAHTTDIGVRVTYKGTALTEGTDYDLTYGTNKYPGIGKTAGNYVKISGKGKYSGDIEKDISIYLNLSGLTVDDTKKVASDSYGKVTLNNTSYNVGTNPIVNVYYLDGTTATSIDTDNCTIDTTQNVPGKGSITVSGKGGTNCVKGSISFNEISYLADIGAKTNNIFDYVTLTTDTFAFNNSTVSIENYVSVKYGVKDVDYEIIYTPKSAAGVGYTVTVKAKSGSNYYTSDSSATLTYNIKYDLDDVNTEITLSGANITKTGKYTYTAAYTGSKITYTITAKYGSTIISNSELNITESGDLKSVGEHQINVDKKSTSNIVMGSAKTLLVTINGIDIANATVTLNTGTAGTTKWYYTHKNIEDIVQKVEYDSTTLRLGTDYSIDYDERMAVGSHKVIIKGKGAYSGTKEVPFEIVKKPIDASDVAIQLGDAHFVGDNVQVKPTVDIEYNGVTLEKGTDYELAYSNNTFGATVVSGQQGNVKITGIGNYSGDITKNFDIEPFDLASSDDQLRVDSNSTIGEYTGNTFKPTIKVQVKDYDDNWQTLTEYVAGTSDGGVYEISTKNAQGVDTNNQIIEKGVYTINVGPHKNSTGASHLKGSKLVRYEVTDRSLARNWNNKATTDGVTEYLVTVEVSDVIEFSGKAVPATIIVKDGGVAGYSKDNPKTLTKDVDYEVEIPEFTSSAKGEYGEETDSFGNKLPTETSPYVIITGKGNYSGDSFKVAFNIGRDLKTLKESNEISYTRGDSYITEFDYDGAEHIPTLDLKLTATNTSLVQGTDYEVKVVGDDTINAGIKTIQITGIGKYYGTFEDTYRINTRKINGSVTWKNKFERATDDTNNNEKITFTLSLDGMSKLTKTQSRELYGTDAYEGCYFIEYDGQPIKPTVTVSDGGLRRTNKVLDESDYEIETYLNNNASYIPNATFADETWASAPCVQVKLKGNYEGSQAKLIGYFLIGANNLVSNDFKVQFDDNGIINDVYTYTGDVVTPTNIVVSNTSKGTLTKGTDYIVGFSDTLISNPTTEQIEDTDDDPIAPGKAYVYVKGINSYSGLIVAEYTIQADLSNSTLTKIVTKHTNGIITQGIEDQFLTGNEVIPIFDVVLYRADGRTPYLTLTSGTDYEVNVVPDGNNWASATKATAQATGIAPYYANSISAQFNIVMDEKKITIEGNEGEYMYTGEEIKPVFHTNNASIVVDKTTLEYVKDGDDPDDFVNVGEVTVTFKLKLSSTGDIIQDSTTGEDKIYEETYKIVARPLDDPNVKLVVASNQRYTGEIVKPALAVYISSEDSKGKSVKHKLKKGTDYAVTYEGIEGSGSVTIKAAEGNNNLEGQASAEYTISLQEPTNLKVETNTGNTVTITWEDDMYAKGSLVTLEKLDTNGNAVSSVIAEKQVNNMTYTFENLENSTNYKVSLRSYALNSAGNTIKSNETTHETFTTNISAAGNFDVEYLGNNKALVSWDRNAGNVDLYYIYKGDTEAEDGDLIAVIPKTTGQFVYTAKSKGTFWYHIDGYNVVNGELVRVNTSPKKSVTIN